MAGVGLLHGVHGQSADGIDADFVNRALAIRFSRQDPIVRSVWLPRYRLDFITSDRPSSAISV
jgi:hypothetical protein